MPTVYADTSSALVTALTAMAGEMTSTATSILPVILPVVGFGLIVGFGIKFFSKIGKKA